LEWRRAADPDRKSLAGVLRGLAQRYVVKIAPTNGQCAGFLHTVVAPRRRSTDNRGNMSFVEGVRAGERRRPFDPAVDMPKLAKAVEKLGDVKMITLDPIAMAGGWGVPRSAPSASQP
jgi:hypothetical protein